MRIQFRACQARYALAVLGIWTSQVHFTISPNKRQSVRDRALVDNPQIGFEEVNAEIVGSYSLGTFETKT